MKRRKENILVGILVLLSPLLAMAAPVSSPVPSTIGKPNIIYIYADDLGYGELGSYGQTKIRTPHLDQMAREGLRFTQHYAGAPVCAPSRAMLMTGLHSGHVHVRGNMEVDKKVKEGGQIPLPADAYILPQMLKKAGYTTALTGKWGLGMANAAGSPLTMGFDYYYGYLDQRHAHNFYPTYLWENDQRVALNNPDMNVHKKLDPATATYQDFEYFKGEEYTQGNLTEKAVAFIKENKEKPFFLYMPYTLPHVSLQAPEEYIAKYRGQFKEQPYYGQQNYASTKYPLSTYAAMITYLDDQVGIIMQLVKNLGLDNNTIIMFSSDNGATFNGGVNAEFFNSVAGLRGLKMDLYEGGIRVPFIARWPGRIPAGKTTDHVSSQYDLMATLADLTGQKLENTDGISFLPVLLGTPEKQKNHDFLYFEYPEKGGQLAVRMGDWKGVKLNLKKNPNAPWQLYNLKTDVGETKNVAAQHPDILKKLDAIVAREHTPAAFKQWEFVQAVKK